MQFRVPLQGSDLPWPEEKHPKLQIRFEECMVWNIHSTGLSAKLAQNQNGSSFLRFTVLGTWTQTLFPMVENNPIEHPISQTSYRLLSYLETCTVGISRALFIVWPAVPASSGSQALAWRSNFCTRIVAPSTWKLRNKHAPFYEYSQFPNVFIKNKQDISLELFFSFEAIKLKLEEYDSMTLQYHPMDKVVEAKVWSVHFL